jgi:hypothetical protein
MKKFALLCPSKIERKGKITKVEMLSYFVDIYKYTKSEICIEGRKFMDTGVLKIVNGCKFCFFDEIENDGK